MLIFRPSPKSLCLFFNLLLPFLTFSQVGINTFSPTKDLDINGELRIRSLPTVVAEGGILAVDANGNVGTSDKFLPYDVIIDVASTRVSVSAVSNGTYTAPLGIENVIFIPANKEARVIISYSVPAGTNVGDNPKDTYAGVTFLKDGTEQQAGSRKYTLSSKEGLTTDISRMTSVSNVYIEEFVATNADRTIVYSLNAYVEQGDVDSNLYFFNMYSETGDNYNWGRASMSSQVYTR